MAQLAHHSSNCFVICMDIFTDLKQYWINVVPPVTKQGSVKQLIPSLLFKDCHTPTSSSYLNVIECDQENLVEKMESDIQLHKDLNEATSISKNKAEIGQIIEEVQSLNVELNVLREELKSDEHELSKVQSMKNEEEEVLKNTVSKVKLKLKTNALATINKDENKAKLKNLIKKANDHLEDLANQWNEVQTPLLEELKTLQGTLTETEAKLQEEKDRLNSVKSTHSKLVEDLKEKTVVEQNLIQKYQQMGRNNNRSAYTKRILEIIGNIRKQNNEIQKVLSDTRRIQKDINNLTGQVDRSFTLCDELIFRVSIHTTEIMPKIDFSVSKSKTFFYYCQFTGYWLLKYLFIIQVLPFFVWIDYYNCYDTIKICLDKETLLEQEPVKA
nr:unnamed protein product [Callosobruchus analis]